jgi:hypothetical protein
MAHVLLAVGISLVVLGLAFTFGDPATLVSAVPIFGAILIGMWIRRQVGDGDGDSDGEPAPLSSYPPLPVNIPGDVDAQVYENQGGSAPES